MNRKIERIYEESIEVFKKCSLRNGAIVASDVSDEDYPRDVKNYFYVWPRDASFVCVACDLVGLHEIPEKFFDWCWNRAELFKERGVFLSQKFYPNGRMAGDYDIGIRVNEIEDKELRKKLRNFTNFRIYYTQFQPDQVGSLLWAMCHHSKFKKERKFEKIAAKAADGICNYWKKGFFKIPSFDLWEEHVALPKFKQVHTYSLAMCIKGLKCACKLIGSRKAWLKCIQEMEETIQKTYDEKLGHFIRTYGIEKDRKLDSSLLGLVWPSEVFEASDPRIRKTVEKIVKFNSKDFGIMRYKGDRYCGKIGELKLKLSGGGYWPILNFWTSIYFSLLGNKKIARKYFNWVIRRVERKIPEQIKNDRSSSVIPLAWSHAMFVIAGKFLKLF